MRRCGPRVARAERVSKHGGRARGLLPVIFDFEAPKSRNTTETVSALAHTSRYIVADISEPRSIPQELTRIIQNLPSVPVRPIIAADEEPYSMFADLQPYPWVLPLHRYHSVEELIASIDAKIIVPAEERLMAPRPDRRAQ